jgi:hypothetical protein
MKKLLFLAVLFTAGISAMAQNADDLIKVSTEKYDFGKIKKGVPVTTFFTITNTTNKPVIIENAWAGCGCTTPEYSKEPIAPGGTSKLKVGYNAAATGHFDKAVNIKLAGVNEPKVIMITGEVVEGNSADAIAAKPQATATAAKSLKAVKTKKS